MSDAYVDESVDLTLVKESASPPPINTVQCERSTQTESLQTDTDVPYDCNISVKVEPKSVSSVKQEEDIDFCIYSDHFSEKSSDSEDMSLINLKKKKNNKSSVNGDVTENRGKKKKDNIKSWESLISSLPDVTLAVADKEASELPLENIKVEIDESPSHIKLNLFHCCVCFAQCYTRNEMLQHYRLG